MVTDKPQKKSKYKKCLHGKAQYYCKDCRGNGICVHNKRKYECRDCGGKAYCMHSIYKYRCLFCSKKICIHLIKKTDCQTCFSNKPVKPKTNIFKEPVKVDNDIGIISILQNLLNKKEPFTKELLDIDFSKVFD